MKSACLLFQYTENMFCSVLGTRKCKHIGNKPRGLLFWRGVYTLLILPTYRALLFLRGEEECPPQWDPIQRFHTGPPCCYSAPWCCPSSRRSKISDWSSRFISSWLCLSSPPQNKNTTTKTADWWSHYSDLHKGVTLVQLKNRKGAAESNSRS